MWKHGTAYYPTSEAELSEALALIAIIGEMLEYQEWPSIPRIREFAEWREYEEGARHEIRSTTRPYADAYPFTTLSPREIAKAIIRANELISAYSETTRARWDSNADPNRFQKLVPSETDHSFAFPLIHKFVQKADWPALRSAFAKLHRGGRPPVDEPLFTRDQGILEGPEPQVHVGWVDADTVIDSLMSEALAEVIMGEDTTPIVRDPYWGIYDF
jgi:hypothetical protein